MDIRQPKVMLIFGTRPEAIKMAPVIRQLQNHCHELQTCIVVTAQHRSMLDQVLEIFHIKPDHDLDIMLPDQSLTETTVRALSGLEDLIQCENPDLVLVQGDTTTAFVGSLAAFYHQIPVGHIEAGLRTRDKYNPYPEEINRHFIDVLADLCFAPTLTAKEALLAEGIPESRILVTGNTVIDALLTAVAQAHQFTAPALQRIHFGPPHRTLLVTAHRRENLGVPLEGICLALRDLLVARGDLQVVFPVHLNPKVRKTVWSILDGMERAWLVDPLDYLDFVYLMKCADVILTDSGGVQEEAPALGKPVLVIRATTERPEAIEAGTARLAGTARQDIVAAVSQLLDDPAEYARMKHAINPYGDGHAAERTVDAIRHFFGLLPTHPLPFQAGLRLLPAQPMPAAWPRSSSLY
jgi:UDP-N-acetylglucosamine 2-epimerase (non-hydrolysing)